MALSDEEIEHRFGNHKATIEGPEATLPQHQHLRTLFKELAWRLNGELRDSREKALALTALEEASMWSHKAIAKTAPLETESLNDKLIREERARLQADESYPSRGTRPDS